jgi:flagellar hook-associated protein 2
MVARRDRMPPSLEKGATEGFTMSSVNTSMSMPTLTVGSNGHVTAGNLVNNLDTTAIVNALMTAASVPQQQLQAKLTTEQSALTQYQNLNQSLQALATAADTDSAANGLNLLGVTSTDPSVTGTASTSANATQLSLTVDQVAQPQISVSGIMTQWPDASGAITIVGSDGTAHSITAAGTDIPGVVSAINAAGVGVTAAAVAVGQSGGVTQYRIQFTSTASGAAAVFSVHAGGAAGTQIDTVTVSAAQDAQVTLWPGTAAAQTLTSTTNTFNDIQSGMTITVTKPTTAPVTVTAALDANSVQNAAETLVGAVNTVLGFIGSNTQGSSSTDSSGTTTVTPGTFSGDFGVREVANRLTQAVMAPVGPSGTTSPSSVGISIEQDGSLNFDDATFQAALAADPAGTLAAVQQIAGRVATAAHEASDPVTGSISSEITTRQTQIGDDQASVGRWNTVLAAKKTLLENQYANLVSMLGQLQSQQQYLQQQFAALTKSNN